MNTTQDIPTSASPRASQRPPAPQRASQFPAAGGASELDALRHENAMLRELLERAPIPLVVSRIDDGRVVVTNRTTNEVFGNGRSLVGETTTHFYPTPEDRAAVVVPFRAQGFLRNHPLRLRRSDGTLGDFLCSMNPARVDGETMLYTYLLDVSDQREAERALRRRNADMEAILRHVVEGLLLIDTSGAVSPERSAMIDRWFGAQPEGATLPDWLRDRDPRFAASMELGLEQLRDGFLPAELSIEQLPRVLHVGALTLDASYRPLLRPDGSVERLLVLFDDVTERVAREADEARARDLLNLFTRFVHDRVGTMEFVDDVDRLFGLLDETSPTVALRTLHTLKGNVALFGMSHLARIAHAIEDAVIDRGDTLDSDERARLQAHWEPIATQLRALEVERKTVLISEAEWSALLDAINARKPYEELSRVLSSLRLEPVARRFDRVGEQARALATRMGRGDLDVEIDAEDIRLPREPMAPLWGALIHAVRNAIDHGIEPPAERTAVSKPARGRLRLCARRELPWLRIEISDDGRGVDWARIAAKARQMGLPASTPDELEAAFFTDGLSTRETVSAVSGRGVGTAALAAATRALGGSASVRSTAGFGTTLVVSLPSTISNA
ncbi:MAG: ATP-binding protein [Polyangiales bacterium]